MVPAPRGRDLWERRIDRAAQLAAQDESTRPLLVFYGQLLGVQRDGYETFRVARLSGSLETDLEVVRRCASATLSAVSAIGPRLLTDETQQILSAGDSAIDQMLLEWWRTPSDEQFFPKVIVQPYAQRLAELSIRPADRETPSGEHVCPFFCGRPPISVIHGRGHLQRGGPMLLLAACLPSWPV